MLVVNFFLFRVLPGDPARTLGEAGSRRRSSSRDFKATYGLDQALPQQFLTFLQNTLDR